MSVAHQTPGPRYAGSLAGHAGAVIRNAPAIGAAVGYVAGRIHRGVDNAKKYYKNAYGKKIKSENAGTRNFGTVSGTGGNGVVVRMKRRANRQRRTKKTLGEKVAELGKSVRGIQVTRKISHYHYRLAEAGEVDVANNRKQGFSLGATSKTFIQQAANQGWPVWNPATSAFVTGTFTALGTNTALSVRANLCLRNNGTGDAKVSVYVMQCIKTTNDLPNVLINNFWAGHTGAIPTVTSGTVPNRDIYISDSKVYWGKYWKIVQQSGTQLLNPGNQIEMFFQSRRYRHSSLQETEYEAYIPRISHVYFVYAEGTVAHDSTTEATVGIGPANIDYVHTKYYHFEVSGAGPGTTFYKFDTALLGNMTQAEQAHSEVEETEMKD